MVKHPPVLDAGAPAGPGDSAPAARWRRRCGGCGTPGRRAARPPRTRPEPGPALRHPGLLCYASPDTVLGLLSLTAAAALAAAPAPTPSPPAPSSDDATYKQLELVARVLSYVQNNHVEKVDERQLLYGAIKGMLDTLDPHTVFMPPEVFKEMKIDTAGEFGGLGLDVVKKGDSLLVVSPVDDTPAARAGIQPGDEILAIDGESTKG